MAKEVEDIVGLIHKFLIEGADATVELRAKELIKAQTARHMLCHDYSKARKLAQGIFDIKAELIKG